MTVKEYIEGADNPEFFYVYFDYDNFRNDLLKRDLFYQDGYYFLTY